MTPDQPQHRLCTCVLMLACNDPRSGVPTGACDQMEIVPSLSHDDALISLEGVPWRCWLSCEDPGRGYQGWLHLGRLRLPWIEAKSCVGNWGWDAVVIPVEAAGRLLHALQRSPRWSVLEADPCLSEAFSAPTPQSPTWWSRCLARQCQRRHP